MGGPYEVGIARGWRPVWQGQHVLEADARELTTPSGLPQQGPGRRLHPMQQARRRHGTRIQDGLDSSDCT